MVKTSEEFKEEVGEEPDGLVSKQLAVGADEGRYMVQIPVANANLHETEQASTDDVTIVAKLFNGLFEKIVKELDKEDLNVYIEVDSDKFTDEWVTACEQTPSEGAFYVLKEDEIDEERTKYVPKVVDKTEEKNG